MTVASVRPPNCSKAANIDGSGALLVGEKGKIYAPGDYCDNFESSAT